MKTLSLLSLSVLGLVLQSGCASIYSTMVAPEVESPVISSEKQVDLVARIAPGREMRLFSDASSRPASYSSDFRSSLGSDHAAGLGGVAYSLKGVSFSGGLLGANTFIEGIWVGGKVQLIGRQGLLLDSPFFISGWGRLGGQHDSRDGDQNGDFGAHGYPWEATRSGSFANGGASIGYEVASWLNAFIGYGAGKASAKATTDQAAGVGNTSPAASYTNSFDATLTTWGGGVQFVWPQTRITVAMQNTRTESGGVNVIGRTASVALELRLGGGNSETPYIDNYKPKYPGVTHEVE